MKTLPLFLAAGAALGLLATSAHASFAPQFQPNLEAVPRTGSIQIDGRLDDAGWQRAARAVGFAEVSPGDQIEPDVRSEAWITYDESNLYVALIAEDDPDEVRVSVCDRDDIFRDDYFGIMIDPYGDQSSGYELFVNPLGIQGDLRLLSNGGEDGSFDMIWESHGQVTETGYQVELQIPFASMRLPDREQQTWRVNFWRDRQRDVRKKYAWAAQNRDDPCFLCQFGTLGGLNGIEVSSNLELIVSGTGSQAGAGDPDTDFDYDDPELEGSANVKYGLSPSSYVELAVNPDFSQVESDAGRIDVNQTFALFFPERRPFFQEGSDLLGTWIDAIYTRSINDPDVAAKFTGQYDKTSVLYTAARDVNSPIIVPLEERSRYLQGGKSVSNIFRARHSLREGSYVGGLVTDRRLDDGGAGTTGGVDALFRRGSYRLELQGVLSRTEEANLEPDEDLGTFGDDYTVALDGESFTGHAIYASLERSARTYSADFDYWEWSPTFRTDNGFTTRNDNRQASFWNGIEFQPNREWVTATGAHVSVGRLWSHSGTFKDEWLRPTLWLDTKGQTDLGVQYLISRERFGPEEFDDIRLWSMWLESDFSEMFGAGVSATFGQGIFRDFDDPELADQRNFGVDFYLKPTQRIELDTSFDFAQMDSRERDEQLFSGYIVRNRLNVSFTRRAFLRLVVQYNDFSERVDVEPLLTYRVNPFTLFYLGSTNRYRNWPGGDFDALTGDDWQIDERQFFAKLQYQFRM